MNTTGHPERVEPQDEKSFQHVNLRIRLPLEEGRLEKLLAGIWEAGGVVIAEGPRILLPEDPILGPAPLPRPEAPWSQETLQQAGQIRARQTRKFLDQILEALHEADAYARQRSNQHPGLLGRFVPVPVCQTLLKEHTEAVLRVIDEGWSLRPQQAPEENDLPVEAQGTPLAGNLRQLFQHFSKRSQNEEGGQAGG